MPITPFHLIAGSSLKILMPRYFSWSTFAITNIIIDLEPILFFLVTLYPSHMFFHTLIGSSIIAILVSIFLTKPTEILLSLWNDELSRRESNWFSVNPNIGVIPALIGALLGAWTHIFMDALMHSDVDIFYPFNYSIINVISDNKIGDYHSILSLIGIFSVLVIIFYNRYFNKIK